MSFRNNFSFANKNSFALLRDYNYVCYKCNNLGQSARFCKNDRADFTKKDVKNNAKETKVWRKKEKEVETKSLIVQIALLAQNERDIWYVL